MLAFNPKPIVWKICRLLMFILMAGIFYGLAIDFRFSNNLSVREVFWLVLIPLMVLIIYFTPLFWRNICPLSTVHLFNFNWRHRKKLEKIGPTANQMTGFRAPMYQFLIKKGMLISAILFLIIVPLRLIFITESSTATFILLAIIFGSAFVMGFLFPVKSGWCTSICPVNAVEKTYSINPMVYIKNQRCEYTFNNAKLSCSGCSFNCMDVVEPEHAYWQERSKKNFHDTVNAVVRKSFMALLPGFITGYMAIALSKNFYPNWWQIANLTKAVLIYAIIYVTAFLSWLLYNVIRKKMYQLALQKEGSLNIDQPSSYYAKLKRKLDLSYITVAINIFWLSSAWGIVYKIIKPLGIINSYSLIIIYIFLVLIVMLFSLMGLKAGWNESFEAAGHRPSWW